MAGYDYKITMSEERIVCRGRAPDRGPFEVKGDIDVKQFMGTISVLIKWLRAWTLLAQVEEDKKRDLLVPETIGLLGDYLWRMAFANDVGKLLLADLSAYRKGAGSGQPFQVRITFDDAPRLAALPWEFTRTPDPQRFFLATDASLVLGRFVQGPPDGLMRGAQDDMVRVLMVAALPPDEDYDREWESVNAVKEMLSQITRIDLKHVDAWDPNQVRSELADFKAAGHVVDVVHLFGVCKLEGDQPMLMLPRGGNRYDWTDPSLVVETLTEDRDNRPALVILHLCEASDAFSDHFEQLAPGFVERDIVAVLAMQYPMPTKEGLRFIQEVYIHLTQGEPIGAAVQNSRRVLRGGTRLNREFGTPVLYLQSVADARLLERLAESDHPRAEGVRTSGPATVRSTAIRESPATVLEALSDVLSRSPEDSPAVREMRDLIDLRTFPADPHQARLKIQRQRRDKNDDTEVRDLCELMLIELDKLPGTRL